MKNIVLFHENCTDGSGAALAAFLKFRENAIYIPVNYNKPLPEIESGSNIFILDFSYPKETLISLNDRSNSLIVLDHHKTAMDQLSGLPFAQFDMDKSGAMLAWEYFHKDQQPPELIKIIQDRDLWKFKIEDTRKVTSVLKGIKDFREYEKHLHDTSELLTEAPYLMKYESAVVDSFVSKAVVGEWDGALCAVVNVTGLFSEVGEKLYTDYAIDFAAMYFVTSEGHMVFSLRSNSFDVSNHAVKHKTINGGGHKFASGMSVRIDEGAAILKDIYANAQPIEKYRKK